MIDFNKLKQKNLQYNVSFATIKNVNGIIIHADKYCILVQTENEQISIPLRDLKSVWRITPGEKKDNDIDDSKNYIDIADGELKSKKALKKSVLKKQD